MELKTIIPWAGLAGLYLVLVYVGGPIHIDFANMAPGIFIIGAVYFGVTQIRGYLKSKKQKMRTMP